MIIKSQLPKSNKNRLGILLILFVAGILIGKLAGGLLKENRPETYSFEYFCGAENINSSGEFVEDEIIYNNGDTRTDKASFEGKYSSYLTPENKYSIGFDYNDFSPGDEIELSLWTKSPSLDGVYLVAQSIGSETLYEQTKQVYSNSKGWHQKVLTFKIAEDADYNKIKAFCYYTGESQYAYIDNFKLVNLTQKRKSEVSASEASTENGQIYFNVKAMDKLMAKRNEALELGLLVKKDNDWVKGKFQTDRLEATEIKARLKGDWTDHLEGNFWSFRIKMPTDRAWNRMMTFSIQNPKTRDFLSEWVFHQLLEYEDVLTPRFDFVKLAINNLSPRIYAYEEHFEKQIVEYKNRREGVIVKFAEDENWDLRRKDKQNVSGIFNHTPNIHGQASIETFKESKVAKSGVLKEQFENASNLLYSFQQFEASVSEVFDLDKLAKYYAICEILRAYHSTIWHNMRYYYNPVIKKLEPIGFDGYTDSGVYDWHGNAFWGAYRSSAMKSLIKEPAQYLFQDKEFNEQYCRYLFKFSNPEYLRRFMSSIRSGLDKRETLITRDHPLYKDNREEIFKTSRRIRSALQASNEVSLKAYTEGCNNDQCKINLTNFHTVPLKVIGTSTNKKNIIPLAKEALIYSNRRVKAQEYKAIQVAKESKFVHFKIAGLDSIYISTIKSWPQPEIAKAKVDQNKELQIPIDDSNYSLANNHIVIKSGQYKVDRPIIIPDSYTLEIAPGTEIDFDKNAYLLSYGAVTFNGLEDAPIIISSKNKSSQGVHVLLAKEKSRLKFVQFNQLNTLSEGSWQMTGAVTFYESPVDLDHVTISHNLCEDALNTIRTDFKIKRLHINNTFADGFDADFCSGELSNSKFVKTGNDGIDFSGSQVTISNVSMTNIGDKGISAGEQATLIVKSATVDKAVIGVASKDLSRVTIDNIELSACNKGFAAYQKKTEYGPGFIEVKSYQAENIDFLTLVENNSEINLPVKN